MNKQRTIATGLCLTIGFLFGFAVNSASHIPVLLYLADFISLFKAEWLAAISGFAAFIVAIFALWHSTLKSPDIKICEEPKFELKRSKDESNHYIPHRFWFEPVRLVYLNHGPRAGAFMPRIEFSCSKEFKRFFRSFYCPLKVDDKPLEKMTYVPIRDRECLIVGVVDSYVEFCDWKKDFDSKPVNEDEIAGVLCQADQHNKQQFSNFCSILKPGMRLGRIDIWSRQTTLGWKLQMVMKEKNHFPNLDGGVIDEESVDNFQSYLKRWDNINPNCILGEIRDIKKNIEKELESPLHANFSSLINPEELTPLQEGILNSWKSRCEGHEPKKKIAEFLIRSMKLDSDFSMYEAEVRKFNRALEISRDSIRDSLSVSVKAMRDPLKNKTGNLLRRIRTLLNILESCLSKL